MVKFKKIFNRSCQHIENSYIDQQFIKNEWPIVKANYTQLVENVQDDNGFHKLMEKLLRDELPLSHTDFLTPEKCEKVDSILSCESVPGYLQFNSHVTDSYLYLKIPTLMIPVFSLEPIAKLLMREAGSDKTVIFDFRLNTGGSASAVGQLLSFFIEPDMPYLTSKLASWAEFNSPQIVYPQPEEQNEGNHLDVEICQKYPFSKWHTPKERLGDIKNDVVLLIDEKNYSCGEVFAQAMKEYGACKLIGEKSSGAVVGARDDYECGFGYRIMLPFVTMESARGYVIEGKGVVPDIEYDFNCSQLEPLSQNEIEKILQLYLP